MELAIAYIAWELKGSHWTTAPKFKGGNLLLDLGFVFNLSSNITSICFPYKNAFLLLLFGWLILAIKPRAFHMVH